MKSLCFFIAAPRQSCVCTCRGFARPYGRSGVRTYHFVQYSGSNERRKFALEYPLIPRPLAYSPIMQLTTRRKTLQSP